MTQPSTEMTQKRPGRTRIDRAPVAKVFGPGTSMDSIIDFLRQRSSVGHAG